MPAGDVTRREVQIPATDGFPLSATITSSNAGVCDWVVINGAFAVASRFYASFAGAVAEAGCIALTYDYRGIGGSRPATLRRFSATLGDWATQDMAGVVNWVHRTQAPRHVFMVGHSLGGILPGLMGNADLVDAMVTVGSENTYWRYRKGAARSMAYSWATRPFATVFGYLPWSRFSSAEDVPAGAALQMAVSMRRPGGILDDPTLPVQRYADFQAPVLAYSISDDTEATRPSVDALMSVYPHVERRHIDPADAGLDRLGHFGYFKRPARGLWPEAISWLQNPEAHPPNP